MALALTSCCSADFATDQSGFLPDSDLLDIFGAINVALTEAMRRGWVAPQCMSAEFELDHWDLLLIDMPDGPNAPGRFPDATVRVALDGRVLEWRPGH